MKLANEILDSIYYLYTKGSYEFTFEQKKVKLFFKKGKLVAYFENSELPDLKSGIVSLIIKLIYTKEKSELVPFNETLDAFGNIEFANNVYDVYSFLLSNPLKKAVELSKTKGESGIIEYSTPVAREKQLDINEILKRIQNQIIEFAKAISTVKKLQEAVDMSITEEEYERNNHRLKNYYANAERQYEKYLQKDKLDTSELKNAKIAFEILNEKTFSKNPAVGRETEIREVSATLASKSFSAILLGKPGVGKTAVVEGIAYAIANSKAANVLLNKIILKVNISSIESGTRFRGDFEEKLLTLINFLVKNPNVILFVDEIHTAYGAGRSEGTSNDFLNIIKPYLENGQIKLIGSTTEKEYDEYLKRDPAFTRRVITTKINEPDNDLLRDILLEKIDSLENEYYIFFADNAEEKEKLISKLIYSTAEKHHMQQDPKYNPSLAISILERAFGYALVDSSDVVGEKYLSEAIKKCPDISNVAKEEVVKKTFKRGSDKPNIIPVY